MIRRLIRITIGVAVIVGATAALSAAPATSTGTVTVSATVSTTAKLTLGSTTVSFPDADPDTSPSLTASAINVTASGKTGTGSNITLSVVASDDLKSGGDLIGIANLTWTVTGTGFVPGTMNKTTAQSLASWANSGSRSGTQTYRLANSWSYATGSYSATITYTLTAP